MKRSTSPGPKKNLIGSAGPNVSCGSGWVVDVRIEHWAADNDERADTYSRVRGGSCYGAPLPVCVSYAISQVSHHAA
jgi:hypothetical protein